MSKSIEDFPVLSISEKDLTLLPEYQWTVPTNPKDGMRFRRANGPTCPEHYWRKGTVCNRPCEWGVCVVGRKDGSGRISFEWHRTGITTVTVPSRSHSYLNPSASTQGGNP